MHSYYFCYILARVDRARFLGGSPRASLRMSVFTLASSIWRASTKVHSDGCTFPTWPAKAYIVPAFAHVVCSLHAVHCRLMDVPQGRRKQRRNLSYANHQLLYCIRSPHRSDNAVDARRTKVIKQVLQTRNRRSVGSQELHAFVDVKRGRPTSPRSDEQRLRCDTPDLIPILAPK